MKYLFSMLALVISIGCHAQIPPTNHTVSLIWTAATTCGTGQPACTYVISRAPATGTTCPATTGTTYTQLNQASPTTGTTYTDTTASGLSVCYIAQTLQSGGVSVPSNTAGPTTVQGNPTAPSLENPTVATKENQRTPGTLNASNRIPAKPMKLSLR